MRDSKTVFFRKRSLNRPPESPLIVLVAVTISLGALSPSVTVAQDFQTLETEHFVVQYSASQEKLAGSAAQAAEEAFHRVSEFLGTFPDRRISLVIAPDRKTFVRLSGGMVPDWGIGLAMPVARQILITSPAEAPARIDLNEIITHEVAHVLLGLSLPGQPLPRWFDEGHAMYHARQWRIAESSRIVWALVARTLIPLVELERFFPHGRASAELAYTESYTTVEFMIKTDGPDAFREFVRRAAGYGDFEAALIETYGWNLQEFESVWRRYLRERYMWATLPTYLSIPGIFTLLFLAAYLRKRYRARRKIAAWQEEDGRV